MNKTAIFRDDVFKEHDPGFDHVECPERVITLLAALNELRDKDIFLKPSFSAASQETILLNHSLAHIKDVEATSGKIYSALDGDTFTSPKSYEAATLAVGALIKGVDLLVAGEIDNGFALVRPPGHHAERNRSMGFCLFNNIALAAHHAIENLGLERVLIIDWDVHHGNGTQNSFYDTDKVLFVSIHQSPLYPGTGNITDFGTGAGKGYTLNIPLPGGQGDIEYANIFNTLVKRVVYQYRPEMILVSAGFDAYEGDYVSSMRLSNQGFGYMTRSLMKWANDLCDGRLLITLEGGYDLIGLKEGVFTVLSELVGKTLDAPFTAAMDEEIAGKLESEKTPHPAIERVRDIANAFWKM
ncbi:MAG: acetoin utilization deacetylase AcuC-like enzyme [Desulforhopalus sp.]|jgi:acetoin utilization deacetylase AcuC-like enzyme